MSENTVRTEADVAETDALTRRDVWLFAPLLVVLVALPLAMVTVVSAGLWFAAHRLDLSLTQPTQSTFAARWPDQALPEKTIIR
jgi:hypothetical protein